MDEPSGDDTLKSDQSAELNILDEWAEFLGLGDPDNMELTEVLRGQMVLEAELVKILHQRLSHYDAIEWSRYDYSLEIQVAEASGFISHDMSRALKHVGKLRNKFAHGTLTTLSNDGRTLYGLLPPACQSYVNSQLSSLKETELPAKASLQSGYAELYESVTRLMEASKGAWDTDWALFRLCIMALLRELQSTTIRSV